MANSATVVDLDQPITLADAAKFFPRRPHMNTLRRWSSTGYEGAVILKTKRSGRHLFTTRRFINEFFDGCTRYHGAEAIDADGQAELDALLN